MTAPTPLLPCPFCGGEAELIALEPNEAFVECKTCRAAHPTFFGKENTAAQAIATWNRRDYEQHIAAQAATVEQLEADAHIAETKFQQQSMILEQQAAEIKLLQAQLAAAQQWEAMPVPVWEPVEDGEYEGQHKHHTIHVDGEWLTISEPYWRTMDDEEPSFEESTIALDDDLRLCRRVPAAQPKQGEE